VINNEILLGHSPDADDAFMFYALAAGKVSTRPYSITHILQDIQTLNERAMKSELDVTAVSFHAYAYIRSHYQLLTCGASMGKDYGPIVVAKEPMTINELSEKRIAIPGTMTTAFLLLRLAIGDFDYQAIPFDQIISHVEDDSVDAGLIIHEGQITYSEKGLYKIIDLGNWWNRETNLPLPLGGNAVKRSLGKVVISDLAKIVHESIDYGLDHFDDALDYAMKFSRDMPREQVSDFVNMYVNRWTLDCGEDGREAITTLFVKAEEMRYIPPALPVDFASID
jgi:1,4-dihydroxy-6-naphthoate synthase